MDKRKRMADTGNITVDMYYIMDSSSNYYRLDADGQLVVAADKDQAGIFSIKEIRNKLGTGKKSGFYRIASVNGNMIWNMSNMEEFNKNNTEEYTEADVRKEEPEYDISKLDWCDYLKNFCYLISTATNYMGQLQKQISDVDLEICDLLHYIELCEIEENEDEKRKVYGKYEDLDNLPIEDNTDEIDMEKLVEKIKKEFKGSVVALCGQTGAGKSSLLNKIDASLKLKTGEVSLSLGRGKHTTRLVELLEVNNGLIADTPGFSSLDISIDKKEIRKYYPDFNIGCKYRSCLHVKEDGCEIIKLVEKGKIPKWRYDNYIKFISEVSK